MGVRRPRSNSASPLSRASVDLARRWLTAVRRAHKPTSNFPVTIAFRQLRDLIGYQDDNPLDHASLTEIFDEARRWMDAKAESTQAGK